MPSSLLSEIAKNDASIVELTLKDVPETYYETVDALVAALASNTYLQVIRMNHNFVLEMSEDDKLVLYEAVGQLPSLKEVHLGGGSLPVAGIAALLNAARAKNNHSLTVLELQHAELEGNQAAFDALEQALTNHASLQQVSIVDFQVTWLGQKIFWDLSKLVRAVATIPSLTVLRLEGSHPDPVHPPSTTAATTDASIAPPPPVVVVEDDCRVYFSGGSLAALCGCTHLKELYLGRFPLEQLHFNMISWVLYKAPHLQKLSLPHTNLDDDGILKLLVGMGVGTTPAFLKQQNEEAGQDHEEKQEKSTTSTTNNSQAAKTLEYLDLSSNSVGDDGCRALADGLRTNRVLKHLNLYDNKSIGNAGLQVLAEMLLAENRTLESLETPVGTGGQHRTVIDEQLNKNLQQKDRKLAMAA